MRILDRILLGYSYTYHLVLVLAALAVSLVAYLSDKHNLRIALIPFSGPQLSEVLLYSSLIGLVILILGITGLFRYAFPVWCGLVLVQMVRWFILSPATTYPGGMDQLKGVGLLVLGAVGAFLSSLIEFKRGWATKRQRYLATPTKR